MALRGRIFKIWTSSCSKNVFAKSLALLLYQIWKCVVFVLLQFSCQQGYEQCLQNNAITICFMRMSVSSTESKSLCLWCCRNFRFCSIQYSACLKKLHIVVYLFLCKTLGFFFYLSWICAPKLGVPRTDIPTPNKL